MAPNLSDLPAELLSTVVDSLPQDDLRSCRLASKQRRQATFPSFGHLISHPTIVPEREPLAKLSTLLDNHTVDNVSRLTIDFTNGIEKGLSSTELADLVFDMTEKISVTFELELSHSNPMVDWTENGDHIRYLNEIAAFDGFLQAFAIRIEHSHDASPTRQNLQTLSISGLSCGVGLLHMLAATSLALKSLTLSEVVFEERHFGLLLRDLESFMPVLQYARFYDLRCFWPADHGLGLFHDKLYPALRPWTAKDFPENPRYRSGVGIPHRVHFPGGTAYFNRHCREDPKEDWCATSRINRSAIDFDEDCSYDTFESIMPCRKAILWTVYRWASWYGNYIWPLPNLPGCLPCCEEFCMMRWRSRSRFH